MGTNEKYNSIRKVITSLVDIPNDEWQDYSSQFDIKLFKKKTLLLQAGLVCKDVFFVNKGLLRIFFIDKDGRECTFHFVQEFDFASDYESFLRETPSNYFIQAIENTEVVVMSRRMVFDGYVNLKHGETLGRLLAEKYFIIFSNKIQALYTQTPMDRYKSMNIQFPGIHQRVPQSLIASYLNISSVHLSRLKNGLD